MKFLFHFLISLKGTFCYQTRTCSSTKFYQKMMTDLTRDYIYFRLNAKVVREEIHNLKSKNKKSLK